MTALTIEPGDQLKDNDKRVTYNRVLTIEGLQRAADGSLEKVSARVRPGGQLVRISVKRIYAEGKVRASGFTLLRQKPLDPRIVALLGEEIRLRRGGRGRTVGPGCERLVRARLDRLDGHNVFATLLEDDPLATTDPKRTGESGVWHGLSFIDNLTS